MEFSIAELLANFADDKLIAPKILEKKLECDDETSLRKLQIALDALEKIGILEKDRGRYRRLPEEGLVEGRLRCSSKGFCFAIQDEDDAEDVYIPPSQLNNAWNGDRVLVRVTKEGNQKRSPEGEVRLILERSNPSVLAKVIPGEEGHYLAKPLDDRLRFQVALKQNGEDPADAIDQLVHVEVLRYPLGKNPPIGRIAKILGNDTSISEMDIVYCKYDLPHEFSGHVQEAIKKLPTKIPKSELKNRIDFRKVTTLTLKPDSTGIDSLDDAITLEQFDDGRVQLGIHIADVAYYVEAESSIDREAKKRGTSVYLGDRVVPMLPDELTNNLCSFQVGKERLAVSVLVTLDEDGEVVEYEIQPTVINVDYQLSYEQAEAILEHDLDTESPDDIAPFEEVFETLHHLARLSQALREQRHNRGAFELNLPDRALASTQDDPDGNQITFRPKFHYDDEGALSAIIELPSEPIHTMIVELVVLANQLVAAHLRALEVPCVYRVHPTPNPKDVEELAKLVLNMGIELQLEEPETVYPRDYRRFTQKFAESDAERVLTYLLLETLKPATYSTEPKPHFGLALDQGYSHFTSPVRRYPDLLVQRVLHAVFEHGRDRKSTRSKETVDLRHSSCHGNISWNVLPPDIHQELERYFAAVVVHLSEREKVAKEAEDDLDELKKVELMRERTGEIFHGLIIGVQSYGLFVELEELLVEGLVHVSSLKDDWYEYRSRQQTLVGRKNRKQYRLGDRIEVQVKDVDYYRQQIDLVALSAGSEAIEEAPEAPVLLSRVDEVEPIEEVLDDFDVEDDEELDEVEDLDDEDEDELEDE
ncbi:MAG TPA: VacB/RNase II family 3'-5' exoribonuclease [Leptolyngbyaceae cyanobacterium M33_DOE_097]|uniref:Ribonuclease R n=1 Tax=Oscillatoriales cyanobacterium SpSt-418 TaxID=2282169 RepID=A0A7C3KEB4_9CYAN|nr:VacB/RNase II family 3'-5' exoribonuclease [Leptolyngbyaceae cyanobacterium M33_DOE_097]